MTLEGKRDALTVSGFQMGNIEHSKVYLLIKSFSIALIPK